MCFGYAYKRGGHDLVAEGVGQHAVLVYSGLVRKSIVSHNCFVGRRAEGDDLAQHLAGGVEILELDGGADAIAVSAHIEGGGDLFQGRIAGSFADAVDGALHLAGAGGDGGQRVGDGETEVVVAMRGEDHAFDINGGNAFANFGKHAAIFFRRAVAHGVRHVDSGGAGFDGNAYHLDEEIPVGACGVFRRELNVVDEGTRQADRFRGQVERFLAADLELVFKVQ